MWNEITSRFPSQLIAREEAETIFKNLSSGGKVTMPLEKASWGSYFGMLTDKFGIQWMMGFDEKSR